MTRRCPNCGEEVPSFSLNCPRCYHSIPREEEKKKEEDIRSHRVSDDKAPSIVTFNRKIVLLLALIPAAFGLMGLAQIYERNYKRGLTFMCISIPLFAALVILITSAGTAEAGWNVLVVGGIIMCLILYIVTYAIQAFDALIRSLFPVSFC